MFEFTISKKSKKSKARIGKFITPHGAIQTPVFMPVGTVGAVKTMTPADLEDLGSQIILGNTYHLYLRPGNKLVRKMGGLHQFMRWYRPILTDSGGFQVFSLGEAVISKKSGDLKPTKISDKGVDFYSHLDGSKHFFEPETSIGIQEDLGSDIIMAFDECPPASASRIEVEAAVKRTHEWLERCIKVKNREDQALFPICQGGIYKDLREESAKFIQSKDLPGHAIGGVSVGESKQKIYQVAKWCCDILTDKKPRYLMGIGYPEDIVEVVKLGIDMFDCVLPTRLARHAIVWKFSNAGPKLKKLEGLNLSYQQLNIKNAKFKNDFNPIDRRCTCKACSNGFSISYIRHLILENEPLGIHLLTCHNLKFVFDLVEEVKGQIKSGRF